MTTASEDGDETRRRILKSARSVFARRGFRGTSTSAIAEETNLSQPAVHYHFGSKANLFEAVLVNETESWGRRVAAMIEQPENKDLPSFLRSLGEETMSNPEGNQLFRVLGSDDYERFGTIVTDRLRAVNQSISRHISEISGDNLRISAGVLTQVFQTSLAEASAMREFESAAYGVDAAALVSELVDAVLGGALRSASPA